MQLLHLYRFFWRVENSMMSAYEGSITRQTMGSHRQTKYVGIYEIQI